MISGYSMGRAVPVEVVSTTCCPHLMVEGLLDNDTTTVPCMYPIHRAGGDRYSQEARVRHGPRGEELCSRGRLVVPPSIH